VDAGCVSNDVCTTSPPTNTYKCHPRNYLDIAYGVANSGFIDNTTTDGFIAGKIFDGNGNVIVNDQLAIITYDDIMPLLEKRVAGEVSNCLRAYATDPVSGIGRYPWAAKLDVTGPEYGDDSNERFGRVPDTPFMNTQLSSIDPVTGSPTMGDTWTSACQINPTSGWWLNWKEHVFYALADAYKPGLATPPPACGSCLIVNPPNPGADKQAAVFVAGRQLAVSGGQPRASNSEKGNVSNYLEDENITTPPANEAFESRPIIQTFNDQVRVVP